MSSKANKFELFIMQKQVALKDIDPNPYRRMKHYPIREEKIQALLESIEQTGLWENMIARERAGRYQLGPGGTHRLAALREKFPGNHKITLNIREFSDTEMLKVMARENMEEWRTSPLVAMETVAAVIEAYEKGEIELEMPKNKAREDVTRGSVSHPYTARTVAKFLGWITPQGNINERIYWVLNALDLIEEELLCEEDLNGLTDTQARQLVLEISHRKTARERQAKAAEQAATEAKAEAEKARDEAQRERAQKQAQYETSRARELREHSKKETKTIVHSIGSQLRSGKIGAEQVRERAAEIIPPPFKEKKVPEIKRLARQLASEISGLFAKDDPRTAKIVEIARFREHLDTLSKELLVGALTDVGKRANKLVEALNQPLSNGAGKPDKSANPKSLTS
jgi:hypothetical protein